MAEVYSSLYKGPVHITQGFKSSHKAVDLGNYKTRNPIYSGAKLGNGTVSYIGTSYKDSTGKIWNNSLSVYINYDSGMSCRMFHGEVGDKVVNVGDKVSPGMQVYRTGNTGASNGDHIHYVLINSSGTPIDPVPYVTNDELTTSLKIGDRIQFTAIQNARAGSGVKYDVQRQTIAGELGTIKDGPRTADSYIWFDIAFDSGGSSWVADVSKFVKYTDPVVVPPVPPVEPPEAPGTSECEERYKEAQVKIEALLSNIKKEEDKSELLEAEIVEMNKEIAELNNRIDTVSVEKNRFENMYNEAIKELNGKGKLSSYKAGELVAELLNRLFKKQA